MKNNLKDEISELLNLAVIEELTDKDNLIPGKVVRRINRTKDQQGQFTGFDDEKGLIVTEVIDMSSSEFLAEKGVIRAEKDDDLFYYTSSFGKSKKTSDAMEILSTWPLYKKNPDLQKPMENFFKSAFSPEHILYLKKKICLIQFLFRCRRSLK